jgi:hypothetical protein
MPCRREANTRSALKKVSAFYFFQGHGDEIGAFSAEITCAVDGAHLELSIDEKGEKREFVSYYQQVYRIKKLFKCLDEILILKCFTEEPLRYRMSCSVSQTAGTSFHRASAQDIKHHRDVEGKRYTSNGPG